MPSPSFFFNACLAAEKISLLKRNTMQINIQKITNARIHEGILCVGTAGSFAAFEVTVRSCFCLSALSLAACRRLKHSSGFWDFGPWQSNCSSVCVWTHIPIGGLPQLCVSHLHSAHICSSLTETQRALWAKMSKRDLISYSTLQY